MHLTSRRQLVPGTRPGTGAVAMSKTNTALALQDRQSSAGWQAMHDGGCWGSTGWGGALSRDSKEGPGDSQTGQRDQHWDTPG